MADSENWRRQRAEELRLHDAGPFPVRPAREPLPIVDDVEPMRRPATVPVSLVPPLAETPRARPELRREAEPQARRQRPQSLRASSDAVPAAPALATRRPKSLSVAARHPLLLGAGIAAALAGAGALGWVLRAAMAPVSTVLQTATREMPPVPVKPSAAGAPAATAQIPDIRPLAVTPAPAVTPVPSLQVATPAVASLPAPLSPKRTIDTRTSVPAASPQKPAATATVTVSAIESVRDPESRFAHPAKAVALPGRDFSPSFNCRRAMTVVNRAICASPELSALDRQVSQTFYRITASVDLERHKAIDRDQTDFLNERARCNSDDCVAAVYRRRLDVLRQSDSTE